MTQVPSIALTSTPVWSGPRPELETDPSFKQLIPYVLVTNGDQVLGYTRGKAGGEGRLHDLVSIGVGGHVDTVHAAYNLDGTVDFFHTIVQAARRELKEEIGYAPAPTDLELLGVILSDASPVDNVHLGLVIKWDASLFVSSGCKFVYEDTIEAPRFFTLDELRSDTLELESWSKLALALL